MLRNFILVKNLKCDCEKNMAIKLSQSLKQTQNLMMTPQLQQAIKLLTMTHLEMSNVIAEEMVENPLLEESGIDSGPTGLGGDEDYKVDKSERQNQEIASDNFDNKILTANDDFDWNSYVETYNSTSYAPSMATPNFDDLPNYENIVSKGMSLADHLEWQLRMETLTDEEWKLAQEIIYNINDDGYLELPFDDVIAHSELKRDHAFEILNIIQRLDPVGCGAENITDCLLAQARIMEERSPLLEELITKYLNDLKVSNYDKICKETGASVEVIKSTALLLQHFNPQPGRLVAPEETHYVVPDIYVHEGGGGVVGEVNDDGVRR